MAVNYRGIIQVRLDINATAEQVVEIENALFEGFQLEVSILDFFGPEKLRALVIDASREYLDFEYSLDTDLYGMDPLQSAMDLIAAQSGCFGVMWIDCDSMRGEYKFFFTENVSPRERLQRSNLFLLECMKSAMSKMQNNQTLYMEQDKEKEC